MHRAAEAPLTVRAADEHLTIKAPSPKEGRIEDFRPVLAARRMTPMLGSNPSSSARSWLRVCSLARPTTFVGSMIPASNQINIFVPRGVKAQITFALQHPGDQDPAIDSRVFGDLSRGRRLVCGVGNRARANRASQWLASQVIHE